MKHAITLETCTGEALLPVLPELARLRVSVFRDWPYLYDGDLESEQDHLARFAARPGAAMVVARAGGEVVGVSTCSPLAEEGDTVRQPFAAKLWPVPRICYFGESVLLAPWRGRGIGVDFFAAREAHARELRLEIACFCAVRRADDHPARPPGATPLDQFWRHRGYAPVRLSCTMRWREVGGSADVPHVLDFWARSLTGAALPP